MIGPIEWRVELTVRDADGRTIAFSDFRAGADVEPTNSDREELHKIVRDAFAKMTKVIERRHAVTEGG